MQHLSIQLGGRPRLLPDDRAGSQAARSDARGGPDADGVRGNAAGRVPDRAVSAAGCHHDFGGRGGRGQDLAGAEMGRRHQRRARRKGRPARAGVLLHPGKRPAHRAGPAPGKARCADGKHRRSDTNQRCTHRNDVRPALGAACAEPHLPPGAGGVRPDPELPGKARKNEPGRRRAPHDGLPGAVRGAASLRGAAGQPHQQAQPGGRLGQRPHFRLQRFPQRGAKHHFCRQRPRGPGHPRVCPGQKQPWPGRPQHALCHPRRRCRNYGQM